MKVIICADDFKTGYLTLLSAQLATKGFDYEIVMVSPPWAWKKKIQAWIAGIGGHQGKVCFLDAYDMLCFGTPEELYNKIDSPLIFAGDRCCWPSAPLAWNYPYCNTPWKYVNAGGLAGFAPDVHEFLTRIDGYMKFTYPAKQADCEQLYFTLKYLDGEGRVDSDCRIFHCMLDDPCDILAATGDRFMNTFTGTLPTFIHGQGKSFVTRPDIFPGEYQSWNWY